MFYAYWFFLFVISILSNDLIFLTWFAFTSRRVQHMTSENVKSEVDCSEDFIADAHVLLIFVSSCKRFVCCQGMAFYDSMHANVSQLTVLPNATAVFRSSIVWNLIELFQIPVLHSGALHEGFLQHHLVSKNSAATGLFFPHKESGIPAQSEQQP